MVIKEKQTMIMLDGKLAENFVFKLTDPRVLQRMLEVENLDFQ